MKPFECSHCHSALGQTNGEVLVIANVRIEMTVMLHCVTCDRKREWRPVARGLPKQVRQAQNYARRELAALPLTLDKR